VDVSTFRFLLTPAGRLLLDEIGAAYRTTDELTLAARFRTTHEAAQVATAMTQVTLREKARDKFTDLAPRLYFTPEGLEQATHHRVAAHRARRIAAAGSGDVLDLCCGIGADLLALCAAGCRVVGVDHDPLTAEVARANVAAAGLHAEVEVADAATYPRPSKAIVFADPARRGPAGRTFDPSRFSPPWAVITGFLASDAAIKLAPGLDHARVPAGVEAEWVSLDGRLREAVLWSGALAHHARHATVLRSDGTRRHLTDADGQDEVGVRRVGDYVFEPDDAVIRAHLVGAFAAEVGGWLLDEHLAYVSANSPVATGLGRGYRVIETLPFKEKLLRGALKARDVGRLTIKKRGIAVTPEELRSRLRLRGSQAATIILTRTPGSAMALLVEPLDTG
jgi:SAM-dependent methyltransferase